MAAKLPRDVGVLFLAGCPRSGTTALQEYLNVHPQIMIGRERYKWVDPSSITRSRFEPDALMEFDEATERYRTDTRRMHMQAILDTKKVGELRWVGDKFPGYLRSVDVLAAANPEARFILTHRPIEPVVNSYIARSLNEADSWLGGRDVVHLAINTWNRSAAELVAALQRPDLAVLPVPYDDFHAAPVRWAERIGSFLDLDLGSEVVDEWRRRSEAFRFESPATDHLSGEVLSHINRKADRVTEALLDEAIGRALSS